MQIIETTEHLAALAERLSRADFVTVDTEFMRETTFWPKLCLVQVASPEDSAIIDPLAPGLSLDPLFSLLGEPQVMKVFHAARQDIEIFHHLSGRVPSPIFDTQVAAMVLGFGDSIAYDQLVQRVTGGAVDKSSRFTDWAARPLSEAQLAYALADVTHLRDIYVHLRDALAERERTDWVAEEMALLASAETYDVKPEDAWRRLKARARSPVELAVLQEIAALREREARERDVPRNRVMKDEVIYEIALARPRTAEAMGKLRAAGKGFERSRLGQAAVAIVNEVLARPADRLPEIERKKASIEGATSAVELMKVLLKLTAEAHGVAPKVIATVDDLEAIVSGEETPALAGWRRAVFGEAALRLKAGEIGIAFDGRSLRTIDCERPVNPLPSAPGRGRRRKKRRGGDGETGAGDAERGESGGEVHAAAESHDGAALGET
jgi:ribonuclease D